MIQTPSSPVKDAFRLAPDGGMIYDPLSRDALKHSKLHQYDNADSFSGQLTLSDGTVMSYRMPQQATAFELIPVSYRFDSLPGDECVHVEATASEDVSRKHGGKYYDTTLPGYVRVSLEYLGYIRAEGRPENRPLHTPDFSGDDQGKRYPNYIPSEVICSGTVHTAPYLWFRFRYTNTGDTILDSDGGGTFMFDPILQKKNEDGTWYNYLFPSNLFNRITGQLYPGESGEVDFIFTWDREGHRSKNPPEPGEYRILIQTEVRNETDHPENYMTNIWNGRWYGTATQELTMADSPLQTDVKPIEYQIRNQPTRNRWLHKYEEFMTSFDSWLKPSEKGPENAWHTLYVQSAPWTRSIALKLMRGDLLEMDCADIPVSIETDSIRIRIPRDGQNYIRLADGTKYPAMATQSMCDMRVNTSLGPDAAQTLLNELLDMKECGVNVVTTTAAFETDLNGRKATKDSTDANWFMADAIRLLDMRMEGYITYPYGTGNNINKARWITKDNELFPEGYQVPSVADEKLALANAIKTVYQYDRWGDNYFSFDDGTVPVTAEDSRGWMRVDISNRSSLSEKDVEEFRRYLKDKYGSIDNLNRELGKNYTDFSNIEPEAGVEKDHGGPSFAKTEHPDFEEWSPIVNELDIFRTLQRVQNYQLIKDYTSKSFKSMIGLRTEGANWTSSVPFDTENQHYRHVYYSQRRCAMIPEILSKSGVLDWHSDYITLPYTPDEFEELTKSSIALGILPVPLNQYDRLRDIAINPLYGQDYSKEYNLSGPDTQGVYINTIRSLFESYKAIYEAGGIPGVLWEDYLCDGFVTETQQLEMKFFSEKIKEAMKLPENREWAREGSAEHMRPIPEDAHFSYPREYVQSEIERVLALRKKGEL